MRNLCLHLIKYLSLASIIWVSSAFKATAQMVKGEICDSSLSKKAYIIYNPEKGGDQFDGVEDRLQIETRDGSRMMPGDWVIEHSVRPILSWVMEVNGSLCSSLVLPCK